MSVMSFLLLVLLCKIHNCDLNLCGVLPDLVVGLVDHRRSKQKLKFATIASFHQLETWDISWNTKDCNLNLENVNFIREPVKK